MEIKDTPASLAKEKEHVENEVIHNKKVEMEKEDKSSNADDTQEGSKTSEDSKPMNCRGNILERLMLELN